MLVLLFYVRCRILLIAIDKTINKLLIVLPPASTGTSEYRPMENPYGTSTSHPKRKLLKLRKYASNGILVAALQKTAFKNITVCPIVRPAH